MSEPSRSGCFTPILMLLAAIFGSFMAAFNTSSSALITPTEIVTHVSLSPVGTFTSAELQQAKEVISKRLNGLGLSTATVEISDGKTISVGLPQVENVDDVVETIRARGLLEFVDFSDVPDFGTWSGRDILTTGQGDHPISTSSAVNPITNKPFETVLTGDDVKSAQPDFDQRFGQWQVRLGLSDDAGKVFSKYTRNHIGKPMGIVLDGKVVSIPVIQAEIGMQVNIIGNFTEQEVNRLAVQLDGGVLLFEMEVESVQQA